jgi:hypothetical protein
MPTPRDFPDELLLLIFEKGCEDDGPTLWENHDRRLKPFTSLARRVCARWMRLVYDPSNRHYWVTRAALQAYPPPEGYLCRQLSTFHRSITQSLGSDLHVSVVFRQGVYPRPIGLREHIADWAQLEVANLKILIYALLILEPFRNQIVRLLIGSSHAQSCKHIFRAFSQICPLPRLAHLTLRSETDPPLPSIGDFARLPGNLGFEPLISVSNNSTLDRCFHLGCFHLQSLHLEHPWLKDFGSVRFSDLTVSIRRADGFSEQSGFLLMLAQNPPMAEA